MVVFSDRFSVAFEDGAAEDDFISGSIADMEWFVKMFADIEFFSIALPAAKISIFAGGLWRKTELVEFIEVGQGIVTLEFQCELISGWQGEKIFLSGLQGFCESQEDEVCDIGIGGRPGFPGDPVRYPALACRVQPVPAGGDVVAGERVLVIILQGFADQWAVLLDDFGQRKSVVKSFGPVFSVRILGNIFQFDAMDFEQALLQEVIIDANQSQMLMIKKTGFNAPGQGVLRIESGDQRKKQAAQGANAHFRILFL